MWTGIAFIVTNILCFSVGFMLAKPDKTLKKPDYICTCSHIWNAHEENNGRCTAAVKREKFWANGSATGWEWVDCACRRYVGDVPLEGMM